MGGSAHVIKSLLCLAAVAVTSGAAQDIAPARPKFEVASVRECKNNGQRNPPSSTSPGRLNLSCWPLWRLINDAYETFASGKVDASTVMLPPPFDDAPTWINSTSYTIEAIAEGQQSPAMMRGPMMQALLEDRFRLKVHRETREVPAYLMTVAKGGLKLKATEKGSCNTFDLTDFTQNVKSPPVGRPWCGVSSVTRKGPLAVFDAHGMTLDAFSRFVHPGGRPVINRTGLAEPFDIHLEWEVEDPSSSPSEDDGASVNVALREQLGLRLDAGKGPREFLVFDHIERPSEN
jgi:uncharacterized protein (TIGR03435 family)